MVITGAPVTSAVRPLTQDGVAVRDWRVPVDGGLRSVVLGAGPSSEAAYARLTIRRLGVP